MHVKDTNVQDMLWASLGSVKFNTFSTVLLMEFTYKPN